MKTIIENTIYGRITYDDETKAVTVQRGDLAERITWLLKDKNAHVLGHGYWPDRFIRVCEVLGIMQHAESVKTEGEEEPPPGAIP
jgi:hypothetical protein